MGCVQLVGEVLNDCAQFLPLIAPTLEPTLEPTQDSSNSENGTDWMPFWTGLIVAILGIGATIFTHQSSSKAEAKRLAVQHTREDSKARREELKLAFAEVLRLLDIYLTLSLQYNGKTPVVEALKKDLAELGEDDAKGSDELFSEYESLVKQHLDITRQLKSALSIIDLLEEDDVYFFAHEYMEAIKRMDGTKQKREIAKAFGEITKVAMRLSLRGERLPEEHRPENFKPQGKEVEVGATKDEPAKQ